MDPQLAPSNHVKWDKFVFKDNVGTLRADLGLQAKDWINLKGAVIWELRRGLILDVLFKMAWILN